MPGCLTADATGDEGAEVIEVAAREDWVFSDVSFVGLSPL